MYIYIYIYVYNLYDAYQELYINTTYLWPLQFRDTALSPSIIGPVSTAKVTREGSFDVWEETGSCSIRIPLGWGTWRDIAGLVR